MKKFSWLIALAVFAVPLAGIIPCHENPVWYWQFILLQLVLFLGIATALWDFNKLLSIFNVLCLFSVIFVTKINPRAMIFLMHIGLLCLASYGISRLKDTKIIRRAIFGIVALQFIWVILQSLNLDPIFVYIYDHSKDATVGFSGSKDHMGSLFAITFPLALSINPLLGIFSLIGIMFSKASFAFASAIISGLGYLFFTSKTIFKVSLIIVLIVMGIFFSIEKLRTIDFSMRFRVWKYTIEHTHKGSIDIEYKGRLLTVKCNPFLGYGLGNFLTIFPRVPQTPQQSFNYATEKFTHAHNDLAEVFFEFGYAGILIWLGIIFFFIRSFIKAKNKTKELCCYFFCIVAYLLNSLGNFISHIAVSGMLLSVFYGLYRGELNGKTPKLG